MQRVEPSSARTSGRTRIVALVVLGLVGVSLLNYYGMASVARASAEGGNVLPALHSTTHSATRHTDRETESHAAAHGNATAHAMDAPHATADANADATESEEHSVHPATPPPPATPRVGLYQGKDDPSELHIVFSMSCTQGKRLLLQSVFQYSATAVGQRGPITQILSGCTDAERDAVLKEPTFYYDFRRHFTPSYSPHPEPGIDDNYTPYNKPFALRHFLEHADPPVSRDVLVLVDADFVFFKPLEVNTGRDVSKYYHGTRAKQTVNDTVTDGLAIAQDWFNYMGAGWFGDGNRARLEHLCAGKPCLHVSKDDAGEYYAGTGPPYIMTVRDMRRMIDDYAHMVVLGRNKTDDWMVEMYAYAVAAANHNIKHTILTHLGVTHPQFVDNNREYWDFAHADMANPCADPVAVVVPEDPPVGVHYCQKYGHVLSEKNSHYYYKYSIPNEVTECKAALLKLPPASDWTDAVGLKDKKMQARKRHEVWTECSLIKIVNQAVMQLKQRTCPLGFNTFQGVEVISDK
ncbi:hypothetical protein PybrP1_010291 [[Pythium] brassicae (nom. inval.)]|nr:hypothetical protein PybrP1_010291 [[Pythium] brassicae (nom. inval.)]